jgi:hypothetical protein
VGAGKGGKYDPPLPMLGDGSAGGEPARADTRNGSNGPLDGVDDSEAELLNDALVRAGVGGT